MPCSAHSPHLSWCEVASSPTSGSPSTEIGRTPRCWNEAVLNHGLGNPCFVLWKSPSRFIRRWEQMSTSAEVIVAICESLNGMFSELTEESCAIKLLHNNFTLILERHFVFFLIRNDSLHQWWRVSYWCLNTRVSEVNLHSHKGKKKSYFYTYSCCMKYLKVRYLCTFISVSILGWRTLQRPVGFVFLPMTLPFCKLCQKYQHNF